MIRSNFWNRFIPATWQSQPSVTDIPSPVMASGAVVNQDAAKQAIKIEQTPLFAGWKKLQSGDTDHTHSILDYQVQVKEDADTGFSVVDIQENALAAARAATIKAEEVELQQIASQEFFAHKLPYQPLVDGQIVKNCIEKDGSRADYECHRLVSAHTGLVGYILLPTKPNANGRFDVKVVFRGTDPNDWQSVKRDLEPNGAGSVSFAANSEALLLQINQYIKAFSDKHEIGQKGFNLEIAGHSLGGADAQYCFTHILQGMAETSNAVSEKRIPNTCRDHLHLIRELHLNTANSAGVPLETAQRAEKYLEALTIARTANKTNLEIPSISHMRVVGDGVQMTGQAQVGAHVAPHQCRVRVFKADIGSGHSNRFTPPTAVATLAAGVALSGVTAGVSAVAASTVVVASALAGLKGTAVSHTAKLFTEPRAASFHMLNNGTAVGQKAVAKELEKNSWWLGKIHDVFHRIQAAFTATPTPPVVQNRVQKNDVRNPAPVLLSPHKAAKARRLVANVNRAVMSAPRQ